MFLLVLGLSPHQVCAIPQTIEQIIRTFEGKNKTKKQPVLSSTPSDLSSKIENYNDGTPPLSTDAALSQEPTNAQALTEKTATSEDKETTPDGSTISDVTQAQIAIDEAIKDRKLIQHPATWYYRGVIYNKLLKDNLSSEKTTALLDETLAAYTKTTQLCSPHTQFHSFAQSNIASLWSYYLDKGMRYYKQENFDQAVAQFAICKRIIPKDPTPILYTAIAYQGNKKPEEALHYYEAYLQIAGPQVAIFRAIANIQYHQLKKFSEAISLLNTAIAQFPFNNELLEEKFLIYKASKQIEQYEITLLEAISAPQAWHTVYEYAYLLENQGLIEKALPYYEQILKNIPNQYNTLQQIGLLSYNEAIKTHALAAKKTSQKEKPASNSTHDWQGLVYVTARHLFIHPLCPSKLLEKYTPALFDPGIDRSERPFFASNKFLIYDHPLSKSSWKGSLGISNLIKGESIPHTSLLYWYATKHIAAELFRNSQAQTLFKLEKYLKNSLYYLQMARKQDKKDKNVANALYYTYFHLKKYGSANRLWQVMQRQKQAIGDDPFFSEKEEKE
ncbi:tetratricopeptide repeat protein [Cardinium endosymbiont of Tipula unca]|uniref:tetratricopeptide repeat protein n=1 Tax=Cardinium endosymbiont of Tipula unca TaxID=3066216 RepID=UPI0030CA7073